jgi:hypothetical protein
MAQPPYLVDVLQIEPGSGDTLTVSRDATAGAMSFVDAILTSGVLLPSLVGLRNVTGLFLVGRGGDGAPYTTIQSALDAIPVTSSAALPSVVLVMPGVYAENLTVQKDGTYIVGMGGVSLQNSGAADTVTISASIATTPQDVLLRGLKIQNTVAAQTCVNIQGADSFATGTITVNAAPLATGDTITIAGTPLTGTAGLRTSGSDDFSVSGMTTDAIAGEIVAALNDSANSFATLVDATSALNVVTLTAVTAGAGGDGITTVSATTPPGNMTDSGLHLVGGGAAGSLVGDGAITIEDCELLVSGAAGFQIQADTVGHVRVRGGTFRGSDAASSCSVSNCALFAMSGVGQANGLQAAYDTTLDRPNDTSCAYEFSQIYFSGDLLGNLDGAGSFQFRNCTVADVSLAGDRSATFSSCHLSDITLSETVALTLVNGNRGSVTLGGGTPTLRESQSIGTQAFAASTNETVSFTVDQPDASYLVLLESPSDITTLSIDAKATGGFIIRANPALTGTVGYSIVRGL